MKSVLEFAAAKAAGRKISMTTCYDAALARALEATAIDCLLVGDSAAMKMPAMTTQERKCGRYIADCTNLRRLPLRTSLISSATMIGTGNTKRIFIPEMISVFAST